MVLEYLSVPLVLFAAFPLVLGSIVAAKTKDPVIYWYPTLKKPSWCPPAPLFGQIWSTLYVLLGLAAFVVWTEVGFGWPLAAWAINLTFNLAWMLIFYNKKDMKLAQVDNLLTLATGLYVTKLFYKIKPVAGALLYPYVAFLVFANFLNLAFIQLNKDNTAIYEPLTDQKNPGEPGYGPGGATTIPSATRSSATPSFQAAAPARPFLRPAFAPARPTTRSLPKPSARLTAAPLAACSTLKAMF